MIPTTVFSKLTVSAASLTRVFQPAPLWCTTMLATTPFFLALIHTLAQGAISNGVQPDRVKKRIVRFATTLWESLALKRGGATASVL